MDDGDYGDFATEDLMAGTGLTVDMLLCDSAQVAGGKLFILGGGLASIGPKPQPLAIALQITVPWDRANVRHEWRIDLIDEDGRPVLIREKPIVLQGRFEAGRPAGLQPGTPLGVSLAINLSPLPFVGGRGYAFALTINEVSRPDWRVRFFVKPSPRREASSGQ